MRIANMDIELGKEFKVNNIIIKVEAGKNDGKFKFTWNGRVISGNQTFELTEKKIKYAQSMK